MSENNKQQPEFFSQIKAESLKQYHSKNYISRHIIHRKARNEYKKLRSKIREFVKNINNSLKKDDENSISLTQISKELDNFKKATLILRLGESNDDILKKGRLNILLNSNDLSKAMKQIEKNVTWGYKTDQIYIENDKINTKRGKSYVESTIDKRYWKKLKRSKTWEALYDLETKIILKFQRNLFENVKNNSKKIESEDVISFALNENELKIKNSSDSKLENINEKPKNNQKKTIKFTFTEDEPGIKNDYFYSIYDDKNILNIEKISKALNAFTSILEKCVEFLTQQTEYEKEDDMNKIKEYVYGLDKNISFRDHLVEDDLLDYRNIIYIVKNTSKGNYGSAEYAIKKFSKKIEILEEKIIKYKNKSKRKIFINDSRFWKTIEKIVQITKIIFDSLQDKERELTNSSENISE